MSLLASLTFISCDSGNAGSVNTQIDSIQTNASGQTTAYLNPEHGQPGHRCDIAVGAPLNGSPAPLATPLTSPLAIPQQPALQTVTAGLNPSHGQPGHRCDIAVGASLDSKPTAVPSNNTATPINITQQSSQQNIAAGLNPAHGQPGHRCDIAVGAPLNSSAKPTQAPPLLPTTIQAKPDSAKS